MTNTKQATSKTITAKKAETVKKSPLSNIVPKDAIEKAVSKSTEKELTKTQVIKNLNTFEFITHWTKTHESKFDSVLGGELVSAQLCEYKSLADFLDRKGITLLDDNKKPVDFSEVHKVYKELTTKKASDNHSTFSDSKRKLLTKYLSKYAIVWTEFARKAKMEKVDSLSGKDGLQICGFINHLIKRSYTFK